MIANDQQFWFVPLGGTGEIGMNMNLYGHSGQWLMVDCGITFDEPLTPGGHDKFRVIAADPQFITQQKESLAGIVITHAHEDHLGGLAHLWRRFDVPVYTTPFTAEVLRRKLAQVGLSGAVPIHEVSTGATLQVGAFTLRWLAITHSVPEPHGLLVETPAATVFHTADWKIDFKPGIGEGFDKRIFQSLSNLSVDAMVCDSTNALKPGYSISEADCAEGLYKKINSQRGRVVVTCFASNVARLIALARIAQKTQRYFAVLGRSLLNMISIARVTGYWPEELDVIDGKHIGYLPSEEVLVAVTGSQGEPRAALHRLAYDTHYDLTLDAGDCVLFSAMVIPGNETPVENIVKQLERRKIQVILSEQSDEPIHASGHPNKQELHDMYQWVKPKMAIPVHGEAEHIEANARVAKNAGVTKHFAGRNGDLYQIAQQPMLKRGAVKTGRISIEA